MRSTWPRPYAARLSEAARPTAGRRRSRRLGARGDRRLRTHESRSRPQCPGLPAGLTLDRACVHAGARLQFSFKKGQRIEKCMYAREVQRGLSCVIAHRSCVSPLGHTAHATWLMGSSVHGTSSADRGGEVHGEKSVTRNGPQPFARRTTSHRRCLVLRTPLRSRLAASARPLVPMRSDAALSLPSLRRNWRQICGGSRGDAAPLLPRRLTARCSRGTCRRVAAAARRRGRRASS